MGCDFSFKSKVSLVLQNCDGKRPAFCFWLVVWLPRLKILWWGRKQRCRWDRWRAELAGEKAAPGDVTKGTTPGEGPSKNRSWGQSWNIQSTVWNCCDLGAVPCPFNKQTIQLQVWRNTLYTKCPCLRRAATMGIRACEEQNKEELSDSGSLEQRRGKRWSGSSSKARKC